MERMPRPRFAEPAAGVVYRAAVADSLRDPVFEESLPIEDRRLNYETEVLSTNPDSEIATAEPIQKVTVAPVEAKPTVDLFRQTIEEPVQLVEEEETSVKTRIQDSISAKKLDDWRATAAAIRQRIQKSMALEESAEPEAGIPQGDELKVTVSRRKADEKEIPDFIKKARAFSQAAASKIDPSDGSLTVLAPKRAADENKENVQREAAPAATEPTKAPEIVAEVVVEVASAVQMANGVSETTSESDKTASEVTSSASSTVDEPDVVPASSKSSDTGETSDTDSVARKRGSTESSSTSETEVKPNENGASVQSSSSASEAEDKQNENGAPVLPSELSEDERRAAARKEWANRVDSIRQRIPDMFDDSKTELKREALQLIREQHKNSRSLVAQLAKTPDRKLVQANAQQKRNAYKMFAAPPSQMRTHWLPQPEPISAGFDVVERGHQAEDQSEGSSQASSSGADEVQAQQSTSGNA